MTDLRICRCSEWMLSKMWCKCYEWVKEEFTQGLGSFVETDTVARVCTRQDWMNARERYWQ